MRTVGERNTIFHKFVMKFAKMEFNFKLWILFAAVLIYDLTIDIVTSQQVKINPQTPVLARAPGYVLGRGSR